MKQKTSRSKGCSCFLACFADSTFFTLNIITKRVKNSPPPPPPPLLCRILVSIFYHQTNTQSQNALFSHVLDRMPMKEQSAKSNFIALEDIWLSSVTWSSIWELSCDSYFIIQEKNLLLRIRICQPSSSWPLSKGCLCLLRVVRS